ATRGGTRPACWRRRWAKRCCAEDPPYGPPPGRCKDEPVTDVGKDTDRVLPPGQSPADGFRVRHYGPVPRFRPATWRLIVNGATAAGCDRQLTFDEIAALPTLRIRADLHCATRWTVVDILWQGVPTRA